MPVYNVKPSHAYLEVELKIIITLVTLEGGDLLYVDDTP